jgi:hypothetical protein
MSDSAVHVLQQLNFERSIVVDLHNLDGSLFEGSLQGTNLAWLSGQWRFVGHRMMQSLTPWHTQAWLYPGVCHGLNYMWIFFFVFRNIYLFVFPARLRMLSMLITFRMNWDFAFRQTKCNDSMHVISIRCEVRWIIVTTSYLSWEHQKGRKISPQTGVYGSNFRFGHSTFNV